MAINPLLVAEFAAKLKNGRTLLGNVGKRKDVIQTLENEVVNGAARVTQKNGHNVRTITTQSGTQVSCTMDGQRILETNISSPIGDIFVMHNAGPIQRGIEATQKGKRNISAQQLEYTDGTTQVNNRWNFNKYLYDFQTFLEEICHGQYVK